MYTLLADESKRTRIDGEFFIYGGIFLKTEYLGQLADGVVAVRNKYELPADAALKFSLPNKPPDMEIQKFHDMRTDVLRLVAELSGKMIVYVVLHDLARSKSAEETQGMGMNSILNRYANLLDRNDTWGLAMIDEEKAKENPFQEMVLTAKRQTKNAQLHFASTPRNLASTLTCK